MIFDFKRFTDISLSVYPYNDVEHVYEPEQALMVFDCYFFHYERYKGKPHPPIRRDQIVRIIRSMPYVTDKDDRTVELLPEDYPDMIEQHFKTRYRNCDYNINHFFSGNIRAMRFYETCY